MHLNMLSDIHMELIHTLNPLYAVPIVAVIFCAFIVYAFGFKSPVPPPSFDGFEEKKYTKKRKIKEIQKQTKLIANDKVNGISSSKGKPSEIPKKKDSSKNTATNEKVISDERTSVDKKVSKKGKSQNDKKSPQERKKENVSHDDLNDDGWVQLLSKKGRKGRKKEGSSVPDPQSNTLPSSKLSEINKSDGNCHIEEPLPPIRIEKLVVENSTNEKQQLLEEKPVKKVIKDDTPILPNPEKSASLQVKPGVDNVDKNLKGSAGKTSAALKDTSKEEEKKKEKAVKTKQKEKKKQSLPDNQTASSVSEPSLVEVTLSVSPSQETHKSIATPKISEDNIDNVQASISADMKSNVAFDELAGLYPEAKEKKKKKVRRDH